jgi:hypothetical protein
VVECVPRGVAPDSATLRAAGIFERRWFALSGTAESIPEPGRVTRVMRSCFVIVNASLAGGARRLATSCRIFERRWFALVGTAEINSDQSLKKIMSCFVIVNASLAGVAPDSAQRAAGF